MKRFVTYLYECERGNKSRNVGFIRVNVRGSETSMEVYIRNLLCKADKGILYVLIYKEELRGIELGEVSITNGQSDGRFVFVTNDMKGSGFSLNDIDGIGIRLEGGTYIASCWKDEYAAEIIRGEFRVNEMKCEEIFKEETTSIEKNLVAAEELSVMDKERSSEKGDEKFDTITYEKIDLSQIRDLPSPNWHLITNSFLVHGFWNYGYLVVKKEMEDGKEAHSLGVPGVFEKPEAVMAILFGFPSFEEIPQVLETFPMNQTKEICKKEKNQEAEAGSFGCWFVDLRE